MDKQETLQSNEEPITLQDINNTLKELLKLIDGLKLELSFIKSYVFGIKWNTRKH